jgi:hypothetical protein
MKLKKLKDDMNGLLADVRGLQVKDGAGDKFEVQTRNDGKKGLFFWTHGENGVLLTRKQSMDIALAILDELDPTEW